MTRQKRQLVIMLLVLIVAVAALVFVWRLPAEEDIQEQRYQITALEKDQISRFSFANESGMDQ